MLMVIVISLAYSAEIVLPKVGRSILASAWTVLQRIGQDPSDLIHVLAKRGLAF